jgi:hypothetical protein
MKIMRGGWIVNMRFIALGFSGIGIQSLPEGDGKSEIPHDSNSKIATAALNTVNYLAMRTL